MPGPGNKKGAQRTKGNLKPSSSSQAAELLAAAGGGAFPTGFIGFGGGAGAAAFVPVSQALEDEDSGLDPTFRVTLRKLSKRDAVTKLKALQEFSTLCTESSEEVIKASLPYWPKIYNKVSMDVDHKVREAAQQAMASLASRVGRNLAPHLKSIMGSWLLSQCDTYPTVASAAQHAFGVAFPPAKQTDAIVYCKEEIAEFLSDNLTVQTPATLSDPKTSSPEDMEMKYNRVVTSSLWAWRKLLETLPPDAQGAVPTTLTHLLTNPKLWKFSKSTVTSVKAALYSFMSGVCQNQTDVAQQFSAKLAPLALHTIDETDSVLCGPLWEAVLSAITYLPNCWNHVNGQKGFLPKLRKLLQNGCHGNASVVGPNLLPLLSKIPDNMCESRRKLLEDFFDNLKKGMCMDQVRNSPSECSALVRAFMECAQYYVKQVITTTDTDNTAQFLLSDQVLSLLGASLVDDHQALSRSPLYELIGQLLQALSLSKGNNFVVESFTREMKTLILENVKQLTENEVPVLEERLSGLLRRLMDPKSGSISDTCTNIKSKPQKSVKFVYPSGDDSSFDMRSASSPVPLASVESFEINDITREIITEVCLTTFTLAKQEASVSCLSLFKVIITTYPDPELLRTILQDCVFETEDSGSLLLADNTDTLTDPALSFIYLLCVPWVTQLEISTDGSFTPAAVSVSIGHLLDISLTLLSTLVRTDVLHVLSSLQKGLTSTKSFQLLVNKCLTVRKRVPPLAEWLQGPEMGERLVSLTQNVCRKSLVAMETEDMELEDQWRLITTVLSSADEEEPVLNARVTEGILGQIEQTLASLEKGPSGNRLEMAIHFVTDVMLKFFCSLKGCLLVPSAERLLLTLFSFSLDESLFVSESCSNRLEEAWRCGVQVLVQQRGGLLSGSSFLSSACQTINHKVYTSVQSLASLNKVNHIVEVLLTTVRENLPEGEVTNLTLQTLLDQMTLSAGESSIPEQVLQFLCVTGGLTSDVVCQQSAVEPTNPSSASLARLVYSALFSSRLLLFSKTGEFHCSTPKTGNSTDTVEESVTSTSPVYEWTDIEKLHRAVYDLTLSEVWGNACSSKYDEEIQQQRTMIETLMMGTDLSHRNDLIKLALDRSDTNGWMSSQCLARLLALVAKLHPDTEFSPPGIIDRYSTLTSNKVQSLQVSAPYLSTNERLQVTEVMVARVISSPEDKLTHLDGAVGALAVIRVLLPTVQSDPAVSELLSALVQQLVAWRQESTVALTSDLSSTECVAILTFNLEVIRILACIVDTLPEVLNDTAWDYVLCSMIGWLQTVDENQESLLSASFPVQELGITCCHLLASVAVCIQSNTGGESSKLPANLSTEWEEFFSEGSYSILLPLFLRLTGAPLYKDCVGVNSVVLSSVSHAVCFCPKHQVLCHQLPAYLIAGQDSTLSNSVQSLLNHFCPLLMTRNRSEQIAAYRTLEKIMGDIPQLDSAEDVAAKADQEETTRSPPESLMKVLSDATLATEVILHELMAEDCLILSPLTEEYNFVLGYLLSWKLLLKFFQHAPSEVRPQYAAYLKEKGTVYNLLGHILCLMPENPVLPLSKRASGRSRDNMFEMEPPLSALDGGQGRELQHVACSVYRGVLEIMPAMGRQWWKDQDRKTAAYVDKFSTKFVSPFLCTSEIQSVQTTDVKLDNITVKARAASREVIAMYDLEEVKTEMVISLPANYPLGNISVTSEKRVGVSAAQWEKWLLQLNIFLQHQNGSIVDGLQMWKRNIDKRFEGVEECTICYSVIHGTTLQLPRLQCRTCKKKFHSACLYKWFNTSHNSTCPLCRNLF